MKTTVIGAFPKVSDRHDGQALRRALHRADRGEIDASELEAAYQQATTSAIRTLENAGVDVINDGQIRWDDLLAPFASAWHGVSRGPLERFYDNNTYFRQPAIEAEVASGGQTLVASFRAAREIATHELKAAVCGPLTFATLTAEDRRYADLESRTLAVARAIATELRGLAEAGAKLVDVEDPAVVARPELIDLAHRAYDILAGVDVPIALQAYFYAADPVLGELAGFPVAQIGVDLRSRATKAFESIERLRGKTAVLGVVDARNTKLETADDIARLADRAARALGERSLWLAPTTGLEYLPQDVALRKLDVLVEGARLAGAVPA